MCNSATCKHQFSVQWWTTRNNGLHKATHTFSDQVMKMLSLLGAEGKIQYFMHELPCTERQAKKALEAYYAYVG